MGRPTSLAMLSYRSSLPASCWECRCRILTHLEYLLRPLLLSLCAKQQQPPRTVVILPPESPDGRPDIDRQAVESNLLELAADAVTTPEAVANPSALPELDAAAIVRPERLVTGEVSGLAVPSMTTVGDMDRTAWGARSAEAAARTCPGDN